MDPTVQELNKAKALAQDWVKQGIDLNEAGKILAYLRGRGEAEGRWRDCLELMRRLAEGGAVRSNRTRGYYRALREACLRHVGPETKPAQAALVMGWAFRLGRFYDTEQRAQEGREFTRRRK
ncbi:MAG: hypothetical protein HY784_05130 [Chloroflexi bacterium]|nr:hypothetical protein [Chloroflexota bacterium]